MGSGMRLRLRPVWRVCLEALQLACDSEPTQIGEVTPMPGLCLCSGGAVPVCPRCLLELPDPGSLSLLGGCHAQLLSAYKLELTNGEVASTGVSGAPDPKCRCAVLLCMATWEATPNSEEVPCNHVLSSELTRPDLQINVT